MWKFRKAAGQKIQIALNPILCKSSLFELLHIGSTQNLSDSLVLFFFLKKIIWVCVKLSSNAHYFFGSKQDHLWATSTSISMAALKVAR